MRANLSEIRRRDKEFCTSLMDQDMKEILSKTSSMEREN